MMTRRTWLGGVSALATAACAPAVTGLYDSAPRDDPKLGPCARSGRVSGTWVYEENEHIRAFFEAADVAAYRQALPARFTMPERPIVRTSVLHFYKMGNGPTYHESEVSVLARHERQPGWFLLTMPVTDMDACQLGRTFLGTPKVMRRVTLERDADRYVGTSYARGGEVPEFRVTVDATEPGAAARELLSSVRSFPDLMLLGGRVVMVGGTQRSTEELERAGILTRRVGQGRLEFPHEPTSLLHQLGVGRPLAAYWAQVKFRYTIQPR
jgi:hypothetical protein